MRASSTSDGDAAHQPCPIESPEDDDDFSNLVRPWRPVRPRRVYARHRWQRACYLCGLTSVTIAAWLLKLSHGRSEPAGPASPHAAAPEKPALTCPGLGGLTGTRSPDGAAAFLGIPYATPPLGEARWRPPRPLPPWDGHVRDATAFGATCPQPPDAWPSVRDAHAPTHAPTHAYRTLT